MTTPSDFYRAIKKHEDYIKKECLADSIVFADSDDGQLHDVEGLEVKIKISKVEEV